LNDGVGGMSGLTVISVQGVQEQQGTEQGNETHHSFKQEIPYIALGTEMMVFYEAQMFGATEG
jgi:hypothetical protein